MTDIQMCTGRSPGCTFHPYPETD